MDREVDVRLIWKINNILLVKLFQLRCGYRGIVLCPPFFFMFI